MLIEGYPEGSDLTLINCFYIKPQKEIVYDNNGYEREQWTKDYMVIIYKDNKNGTKGHYIIKEPEYHYYIAKPDKKWVHLFDESNNTPYPQYFAEKEDLIPVTTKYRNLEKDIFTKLGLASEFSVLKANGDRDSIRSIHKDQRIFMSDCSIEDHYRFLFSKEYTNSPINIHKGFFDIEVDSRYIAGDFPELGEAPVNCISYMDDKFNSVHSFILRNKNNPLIEEFEKQVSDKLINDFRNFIIDAVGGKKKAKGFNLDNLQINLHFYDSEIKLISEFFETVHKMSPDFCLGYNMSNFDMPYLIQRIINLDYNPLDIIPDKSFPREARSVYHFIDQKNANNLNKRTDFTNISGHEVWIDQLIQFASKRSAKYGSFTSFKLDDIAYATAGIRKLDYHHITTNIAELPYLNFYTFVLYNIMDTICQHCIEWNAKDMDYLFNKCIQNNTTYAKAHRQTVYLINRFITEYDKKGYVIGNNMNTDNEKPDKFQGALVGNPKKISNYSLISINGIPVMISDNNIDEDFKALYPSIAMQNNTAPNTQIGMIDMPEQVYDNENADANEDEDDEEEKGKYSRSGEMLENYMCRNMIIFANRYFKLASFRQFIEEDLPEYIAISNSVVDLRDNVVNAERSIFPFIYVVDNKVDPFVETITNKQTPFVFTSPTEEDTQRYIDIIKGRI